LQREVLLKIIAIELLILAFVKYQLLETKEGEEVLEEKKELKNKEDVGDKKTDIYEMITKGKEFMKSVKPYLNKKEQYYVEMFTKMAEIVELQKELFSLSEEEIKTEEEKEPDKIGILNAIKPYISEDKQEIIDKFLKFHEALKNLHEKIDKFSKEGKKTNPFDRIVEIYEAIRPLIPEEKVEETDKLARNIKLLEVINKAEGLMNNVKEIKGQARNEKKRAGETQIGENTKEETEISNVQEGKMDVKVEEEKTEKNDDSEEKVLEGLSKEQQAVIDNLKSLLTKEQQQYMYNMINYLKHYKSEEIGDNKGEGHSGE
jgi:hypothetical protein